MKQNDISAILPKQGELQQHYLQSQDIGSKIIMENLSSSLQIMTSTQYINIYYSRLPIKVLLEQRSLVYDNLKLNLKSSSKKNSLQTSMKHFYDITSLLFEEFPQVFDPLHFVFINDCGVAYGFFSGDGKYVPMCKKCNMSIYILIRINIAKIVCTNPKCKIKLLEQRIIETEKRIANKRSIKPQQSQPSKSIANINNLSTEKPTLKVQQKQRQISLQQLNLIRKAAKKIVYS